MNPAYFFDANAVYKYYRDEPGSEVVRELVAANPYRCFISEWSKVEFISIFRRYIQASGVKKLEQEQRKQDFDTIYGRFLQDINEQLFIAMPIPPEWSFNMSNLIIRWAIDPLEVAKRPSLKAPDALQFITFRQLCHSFPQACMVTNDKPLITVCQLEQLEVLDPIPPEKRILQQKITFVLCINNDGYPALLELRKVYQTLPDPNAEKQGQFRLIDESGKDYLYPATYFVPITVPELAHALFATTV